MGASTTSDSFRVSVALCSYNGACFIEEQLRSVLGQTRLPDEIIVCDDGSTDGTIEIVETVAAQSPVPILLHRNEENLGVTRNFEKAIGLCSGDVIFLSDQDDVWFEGRVERMLVPFSESRRTGLAYCDAQIVDGALRPTGDTVFRTRGESRIWMGNDRFPEELVAKPNIKGCTMAIAARFLPLVLPIPSEGGQRVWSHDYWTSFMLSCVSEVAAIEEPLMYYRIHEDNLSANIDRARPPHGRLEDEERGIVRYSTAKLRRRCALFRSMLDRIAAARRSGAAVDPERLDAFAKIIEGDLALLEERVCIIDEPSFVARLRHVATFLDQGKYGRFKKAERQVVKDALRLHKAGTY